MRERGTNRHTQGGGGVRVREKDRRTGTEKDIEGHI